MKRWGVFLGWLVWLVALADPAWAWRPANWVYVNWPYAYDHAAQEWYWFSANAPQPQWVNGFPPANGWQRLPQSALAHGWSWFTWPYAYSHGASAWQYSSANGRQSCVNLRTGAWSVFGQSPMALIPAGDFQMGFADDGVPAEAPVHTVTVSAFLMDRYEVSKVAWDEVYRWAIAHGYSFDHPGGGKGGTHPVSYINWYDIVKWCNARSEMEGRAPAYYTSSGKTSAEVYRVGRVEVKNDWVKWDDGYRLPTEAEWEKAARGGLSGQRFPWGDTIDHSRANYQSKGNWASYDLNTYPVFTFHPLYATGGEPYTNPTGAFAPNGYGLYDMSGNVREWCWDYAFREYTAGVVMNPHGPESGTTRIIRGGSYYSLVTRCRVSDRTTFDVLYAGRDHGFRTVLPADR